MDGQWEKETKAGEGNHVVVHFVQSVVDVSNDKCRQAMLENVKYLEPGQ